jgi:hypothetical protein
MPQLILADDIDALCEAITKFQNGIVVFDGFLKAGKTCQARMVAERLKLPHIDLDDYFIGGDPGYRFVEALSEHAADIRQDIHRKKKGHSHILISTICAREIVRALRLRNIHYVYIEKDRKPNLKQEVLEYHIHNKPRNKA